MVVRRMFAALAIAALFSSCGPPESEPAEESFGPIAIEGQMTLNDRCPVRRAKLNSRVPPVLVNGRPIGFC